MIGHCIEACVIYAQNRVCKVLGERSSVKLGSGNKQANQEGSGRTYSISFVLFFDPSRPCS